MFWTKNWIRYRTTALIGLFMITIGTGMQSCLAPFGADQFDESDTKRISRYFAVYYASTNVGAFVANIITPAVRLQRCGMDKYGIDSCFKYSFWLTAIFIICAMISFFSGSSYYSHKKATGSLVFTAAGAITSALKNRSAYTDKRSHWLDSAAQKYDSNFINDLKKVFPIFVMYIPVPFFWALFDLKGSRWILSGTDFILYSLTLQR